MTMATRNRSFVALLVLALLAMVAASTPADTSSQASRSAFWREYNAEITVNEDGSFRVVETQLVAFNGTFRFGSRVIPTERMEGIGNLEVAVANSATGTPEPLEELNRATGEPGTYTVAESRDSIEITYYFDPTRGSEDRLIVIEYDVVGGLRDYPNEIPANQQLRWIGVPADVVNSADVRSSTITVHLPEPVAHENTVYSPPDAQHEGDTFTWTRQNLNSQFEINLQFPPITAATAPSWQAADDARREEEAKQADKNAVAGTAYLAAGLLIAVGGTLFVLLRWYTTGRDPKVGLVADIVTSPPDDLHPGAAGTLVDERTDTRDVVATLVDLGRRNVIRIDEETSGGFMGFGGSTVYTITIVDLSQPREPYEDVLLDAIFNGDVAEGNSTPMHRANERIQRSASRIHEGFYQEVVDHGYFEKDPNKVRARYSMMGIFAPILAVIVWIVMGVIYGGNSGWLWFMAFAAAFVFFIGMSVSNAMVRKTMAGAEAAAKWNAFKRYLEDIDKQANLEEGQQIFEQYLPYAVAFGIEGDWVTKFERAGVPAPTWFGGGGPIIIHTGGGPMYGGNRGGGWVIGGGGGGPFSTGHGPGDRSGGGGGLNFPDLQGGSDSAARGLGGASGSLLGMLGTAAKVLSNSSGGGGFGGGGGGGFSGGGGFGGGGGGGSSSFG